MSSDDISNHETSFNLPKRYEGMHTVPGTRSYHCFIPDGDQLFFQRVSSDTVYDMHKLNNFDLTKKVQQIFNLVNTSHAFTMMNGI